MTVAVVATGYGDPWREDHVLVRRLAGALACVTEVDVLLPGTRDHQVDEDGAVRLLRFPAVPRDPRRHQAWRRAMFGEEAEETFAPPVHRNHQRGPLAATVEEHLVMAEGGDSPALYEHLESTPYDLVVFVGHHSPLALSGPRALDRRRFVVVPANRHEATLALRIYDELFDRAERILVCTESEREALRATGRAASSREGGEHRVRSRHQLAGATNRTPRVRRQVLHRHCPRLEQAADHQRLLRWAEQFKRSIHPDLRLRLVRSGGLAGTARARPHRVPTRRVSLDEPGLRAPRPEHRTASWVARPSRPTFSALRSWSPSMVARRVSTRNTAAVASGTEPMRSCSARSRRFSTTT